MHEALRVGLRRLGMLQGRIIRHETENVKPAAYDRREMRAWRRLLMNSGLAPDVLPVVPEEKLGPVAVPALKVVRLVPKAEVDASPELSAIAALIRKQDQDWERARTAEVAETFTGLTPGNVQPLVPRATMRIAL